MCPKSGFQEKKVSYNLLKMLRENYQNFAEICQREKPHECTFAVCVCGQSGFFALYLEFFQVSEKICTGLKKKKKKRELLGNGTFFFLQFFKL